MLRVFVMADGSGDGYEPTFFLRHLCSPSIAVIVTAGYAPANLFVCQGPSISYIPRYSKLGAGVSRCCFIIARIAATFCVQVINLLGNLYSLPDYCQPIAFTNNLYSLSGSIQDTSLSYSDVTGS